MKEIDEQAMRITEEQIKYYKLLKEPSELEEIPIDILRGLYSDLLLNTEDIKKEHAMMVNFIKENGLWNKFLNSDDFIDHLNTSPLFVSGKDEKEKSQVVVKSICLHCGEGKPYYCEKCYQDLIAENIKLRTQLDKLSIIKEVNNNESND